VEAFAFDLDDAAVHDLRQRLARTRWPDASPKPGWELGTEIGFLRALCRHWEQAFDFDAFAARCNRYPQVMSEIDGIGVHAIVAEPTADAKDPTALLLLHGWPSSVAEYWDVIEPLRRRHRVVVASLPGYGFSRSTDRPGVDPLTIATTLVELMRRLGHARFFVAGGDWGAIVSAWMGAHHADALHGVHLTLLPARPPKGGDPMEGVTDDERALMQRAQQAMASGTGYQAIQSTKPQSLAYGLTDSPAGLAGWIIEKFHAWSDCDGDPLRTFGYDRLLENISIYWFTGTINSSMRLYHEALGRSRSPFPDRRVEVPTGHAVFPAETFATPRAWADAAFEIVRWTRMPAGGHFAAMETPVLYAPELLEFTAQVLSAG
jgi:pimeloyl-ACP methyl ester carboxylesterase